MENRYAVILAAGKGTRMKSKLYKVLHPVCGKPMVQHVLDQVRQLNVSETVTIVGHGSEMVKAHLQDQCEYALQEQQLGTAHAVMQAAPFLSSKEGVTLVVCGDTPLITDQTMEQLFQTHKSTNAKATILTAYFDNPTGYGRIIRNIEGHVEKIVEQKDANEVELSVCEINTGTYCFDNEALFTALQKVSNSNAQNEYYLTDVIEILKKDGHIISAYQTDKPNETLGVNDRVALATAEQLMKQRINESHMRNGVTIIDPSNTYIGCDCVIGEDTVILPGTILTGKTIIGSECVIGPNTEINDCQIGNNTTIKQSVVLNSSIGSSVAIGPFAHIRPDSQIEENVKIGNFVEIKKSLMKQGAKASHLTYLGDAQIGEKVNIGCGTITVNYDGKNKFQTIIEDGAFIGCNSNLIAPVTIEKNAYVAAGSTITENVPPSSLAIARARQVNKEGYVEKLNKNN